MATYANFSDEKRDKEETQLYKKLYRERAQSFIKSYNEGWSSWDSMNKLISPCQSMYYFEEKSPLVDLTTDFVQKLEKQAKSVTGSRLMNIFPGGKPCVYQSDSEMIKSFNAHLDLIMK